MLPFCHWNSSDGVITIIEHKKRGVAFSGNTVERSALHWQKECGRVRLIELKVPVQSYRLHGSLTDRWFFEELTMEIQQA